MRKAVKANPIEAARRACVSLKSRGTRIQVKHLTVWRKHFWTFFIEGTIRYQLRAASPSTRLCFEGGAHRNVGCRLAALRVCGAEYSEDKCRREKGLQQPNGRLHRQQRPSAAHEPQRGVHAAPLLLSLLRHKTQSSQSLSSGLDGIYEQEIGRSEAHVALSCGRGVGARPSSPPSQRGPSARTRQ